MSIDLDQIQARITDCQTYKFGMFNADKLAHEDAAALLAYARDLEARNKKAKADAWDEGCAAALTAEGYSETGLAAVFADNPYRAAITAMEARV